ncbi:hypothetical protein GCM10010339_56770 [Streptomyces alanosinicus]|uniref:Uncharacterized protein n=1 Tax=Streptomyces alanosinicus TaxID=68171 RepID=A0A918YLL0_9ACTN|nr:hypothetical protein GCM10010339_56770 [Streptomyces alanosinicus]
MLSRDNAPPRDYQGARYRSADVTAGAIAFSSGTPDAAASHCNHAEVGGTQHADTAVAPLLRGQPRHRVGAVRRAVRMGHEHAGRSEGPAAVLDRDRVAFVDNSVPSFIGTGTSRTASNCIAHLPVSASTSWTATARSG